MIILILQKQSLKEVKSLIHSVDKNLCQALC